MQAYSVPCWWVVWWLWRAGCTSHDTYLLYCIFCICQLLHSNGVALKSNSWSAEKTLQLAIPCSAPRLLLTIWCISATKYIICRALFNICTVFSCYVMHSHYFLHLDFYWLRYLYRFDISKVQAQILGATCGHCMYVWKTIILINRPLMLVREKGDLLLSFARNLINSFPYLPWILC